MIIDAFVEEAEEHISSLKEIYGNATEPPSKWAKDAFLMVHTIKGNAKFLRFENLGRINSEAERVLDLLRESKIIPKNAEETQKILNVLKTSLLATEELINYLKINYKEDEKNYEELITQLTEINA